MPDPVADYETAATGFAEVLAQCGSDLGGDSPCEGWKAQDVVDHVLGGTSHFTAAFGGQVPDVLPTPTCRPRYATLRAALVEACRQPGALDQMVDSPLGGQLPGSVMLGIYTTDTLIHTWDLARAIGVDVRLDADLLERSWEGVKPIEELVRTPGVFGSAVDIDDSAPMQDRAMAWFGRQP